MGDVWTGRLLDQLAYHWENSFRPKLESLTDDEYLWEPTPNCWNLRPRAEATTPMATGGGDYVIDYDWPEPTPPPLTTIAWRMTHVIVGVFGSRNHIHFAGAEADYSTWVYAPDAAGALEQLDEAYDRWATGVRGLDADALERPIGEREGEWAASPMADLVLHISREAIHHGAEMLLLRDLYRASR